MKVYSFINENGQKTTINTDLIIAYYVNNLNLVVKLRGHELTIDFTNEKSMYQSYDHLHSFMLVEYK